MSDLILPGAIPKLPRRCSPIVVTGGQYAGRRGVIVEDPKGYENALICLDDDGYGTTLVVLALSDIALDLSDATGRAHAAWRVALCEVPQGYQFDPAAVSWARAPAQGYFGWELRWLARNVTGRGTLTGAWWTRSAGSPVPPGLLDDLDPDNPRLLLDGTRWVDAVALGRVCTCVSEKTHV